MKRELLLSGTAPPPIPHVSTLCCQPDITTRDQISQAFLLCISILQAIKYWRWERPGNEANWGEPERAPHGHVNVFTACIYIYVYIYICGTLVIP